MSNSTRGYTRHDQRYTGSILELLLARFELEIPSEPVECLGNAFGIETEENLIMDRGCRGRDLNTRKTFEMLWSGEEDAFEFILAGDEIVDEDVMVLPKRMRSDC